MCTTVLANYHPKPAVGKNFDLSSSAERIPCSFLLSSDRIRARLHALGRVLPSAILTSTPSRYKFLLSILSISIPYTQIRLVPCVDEDQRLRETYRRDLNVWTKTQKKSDYTELCPWLTSSTIHQWQRFVTNICVSLSPTVQQMRISKPLSKYDNAATDIPADSMFAFV